MNYQEVLNYLYERLPMFQRLGAPAIKKDLTNTIKLLDALGNPHLKFKSVHIAGTNGKGSSAHALAAILQKAGYKTGLYTSPHLKSFTERIRLNGAEVSQEYVERYVNTHQQLIETVNPSFFEVTVAMSFAYFAEEQVDIAIVETGLGGRLDSTNVIHPLVALITMIGYDHADLLGSTLREIAGEKAGIIKHNTPVIIGANQPELLPVFQQKADEQGALLKTAQSIEIDLKEESLLNQVFDIKLGNQQIDQVKTDITARYFLKNLPGIYAVVQELQSKGFNINEAAIRGGLADIKGITGLKGRWQVLAHKPLVIADVSHNEPGLQELFAQVEAHLTGSLHLIIGMVKDKEVTKVLAMMPANAQYYFTQSSVPRSLTAEALTELAKSQGIDGHPTVNVNEAIAMAKKNAHRDDLILICGSTFVVAEIENL